MKDSLFIMAVEDWEKTRDKTITNDFEVNKLFIDMTYDDIMASFVSCCQPHIMGIGKRHCC